MAPRALDAATLEKLISAAIAAPSIHNTQPWRYRLDPDSSTLEVRAAAHLGLRHTDPTARALHVSVGAALFNLRIAAAHFGWEPAVRLLPDPAEPALLATVRLTGGPPGRNGRRDDLYDVIWRRHSSRAPFTGRRPPTALLAELAAAARVEGATLYVPPRAETSRVLRLTMEGEGRTARHPERAAESRSWIRDSGSYGLTPAALGPQDARGRMPMRDFAARRQHSSAASAVFEPEPVIAVLGTRHDRRADWLRAGQALEHVLLIATAHRLRSSLLHQAVEWPDLRSALPDGRHESAHVQMLIRLGYGPEGAATPRRAARDVLEGGSARS